MPDVMLEFNPTVNPIDTEVIISIKGLCKSFTDQVLYENFNLDLPRGHFISIFGPNGCGKSTLINMMSGLVPFDKGQILINDKPIRRARIGYVFQNYRDSLFPWLSALDNIAYPLQVKGMSERQCETLSLQFFRRTTTTNINFTGANRRARGFVSR
jgi:NitT/TauT family transport system ATP-binding protein